MAIATELNFEIVPKNVRVLALLGSVRDVYELISKHPMKVTELQRATRYSNRTIRNALRKLEEIELARHYLDMTDLRSKLYAAA